MALAWLDKLRGLLPGRKEAKLEERTAETREGPAREARGRTDTPAPPERTWTESVLDAVPLAMLIIGGLLTASTQIVGFWALLGYLLLALSPVVFWLKRIDKRLRDLTRMNRQR